MENVHSLFKRVLIGNIHLFKLLKRNMILIIITPLICVMTMAFKVLYKSILHCSVPRVTASILYIVLPSAALLPFRYTSIIVYRWYENLPQEWSKIISLPFFHKLITLFHFSPAGKSEHIFLCMFLRTQGYRVTNFSRKTKVSSYKCWRWKNKIITFASSTY